MTLALRMHSRPQRQSRRSGHTRHFSSGGGTMKKHKAWLAGTAAITLVMAASGLLSGNEENQGYRQTVPAAAHEEIKSVESEIDRIEDESLNRTQSGTLDGFQRNILLGKLIFYDQKLAVNRNEACA